MRAGSSPAKSNKLYFMIPSCSKPKYKSVVKLRFDVNQNLRFKNLKKKKWRLLIGNLKRNLKFKTTSNLFKYQANSLPKFRVYFRYKYQKNLFIRKIIKSLYGSLQDYKIKYIARKSQNWLEFARNLEQSAPMFLYRCKLSSTFHEALTSFKHKRIMVNGCYKDPLLKKGDVLHFTKSYENVLKKRIKYLYLKRFHYIKTKGKYDFSNDVDFDVINFRFFFINNLTYFKNHPFFLPFKRTWRYYTRV